MGSDTCMGIYTASKWASLDLNPSLALTGFPDGSVVKNLPAMQETQVQTLGRENPQEKGSGCLLHPCCAPCKRWPVDVSSI